MLDNYTFSAVYVTLAAPRKHLEVWLSGSTQLGSARRSAGPAPRPRCLVISLQVGGKGKGKLSTTLNPEDSALDSRPGAWHCAGSWEDVQDPVQNTAVRQTAKRNGKVPQRYLSLPAHPCATGVSQSSQRVSHAGPCFLFHHVHILWMAGHAP